MALGKLFRTTAFKLSAAYLVIFGLGARFVLGGVGWNVKGIMDEQIAQTIEAEITGLSEQYAQGGMRQLVDVVERRAAAPGSSIYLITTFAGERIAGNISVLPTGVLDRPGVVETDYERGTETRPQHRALARIFVLPAGFRLVVGHDLEDREALRGVLGHALLLTILWLLAIGTLGGLFVARRVLKRVDAMSASARTIMGGDMRERLPLSGSRDELDRLAENLNAMLDRVSDLLRGLQEVSENIAHDLRTPLTRLRNSAEQVLRTGKDTADYRMAVDKIIDEADGLIRIFNALLMIARAEAGAAPAEMLPFNLADVAHDMAEFYEPLAEEKSARIVVHADPDLMLMGSRELISQALANLVDNALKYGIVEAHADHEVQTISIDAHRNGDAIELRVADSGPGIPVDQRTHVLDRFVRLEQSRTQPGSGLGLSLAAAVAHLHKGTILIGDNNPGLRITLTFAALDVAAPALSGGARQLGAADNKPAFPMQETM